MVAASAPYTFEERRIFLSLLQMLEEIKGKRETPHQNVAIGTTTITIDLELNEDNEHFRHVYKTPVCHSANLHNGKVAPKDYRATLTEQTIERSAVKR